MFPLGYNRLLTFQSFLKRIQELFKLHLFHCCQDISCIHSFPFGFHCKVVCTAKGKEFFFFFFKCGEIEWLAQIMLPCSFSLGNQSINSYQDVAYSTNTLAAWEMALRASFDTFTPSGSCEEKQRWYLRTVAFFYISATMVWQRWGLNCSYGQVLMC